MYKFIYKVELVVLLVTGMLAGCATTPSGQQANASSDPTGAAAAEKPISVAAPAASADKGPPAAVASQDAGKTAAPTGKTEIHQGTGVFVNPPKGEGASKVAPGDEVMLNFEGADLREVVKAIVVDFLRGTYIMDLKVQGVVSLHTTSPIPRSALLPTLETVLRMNGAAIVKEEGIYKVIPAATAVRGSITPQLGSSNTPLPGGFTVQIVPLKFIAAKEMLKILEPFVADATAARIDEVRNLVILSGTERELRHLLDTIEMFDIDWLSGMSVGLFTLQNVDVKTAVADLDKVFGPQGQSPLSGLVKFVPIERLNALLVVTQQAKYLDQAKIWIDRMDRAGGVGGGTRLFVYPVQNGQAEKLATLLNDLFAKTKQTQKATPAAALAPGLTPSIVNPSQQQAAPPAGSVPGVQRPTTPGAQPQPAAAAAEGANAGDSLNVSSDVRVIADKDNNALLILAAPSDYEKIESAIRKLDVVPRQVLVDVTVAEVTLTGDLQFGVSWYFANSKNLTSGAQSFSDGNKGTLSSAGAQYVWSNARVGALLNMLQSDKRAKVISSPHIMVTENQVAKINVGTSISVTTQTQSVAGTSTGILTGSTYVATGIILSVTPHIHAGGLVTMEIDQQVTTPGAANPGENPPINTRAIQSTVTVRTGETMVLGGLIQDQLNTTASGLPLFSQIPVVGGLFGSQERSSTRSELVMLITPRVVESTMQARNVTEEFRKKLAGLADYFEKMDKANEKPKIEKQDK